MLIRIILVAVVLVVLFALVLRRGHTSRAWTRILFIALAAAAIVTLIHPEISTTVAGWFGVGRGTDLLLYAVTAAFLYFIVAVYRKFQALERRQTILARKIAIDEAMVENSTGD